MIRPGHYHFVGVAGVGMSALAQVALVEGCAVSGSDRDFDTGKDLEVIHKLRLAGVQLVAQDGGGVRPDSLGVVVSTAIEAENPDVAAAKRLGVPVIHRAEMLAGFMEGKRSVAVTGTSGKSTVTGMIGWALEAVGADPVVVNGAPVLNWRTDRAIGNVRCPGSDLWVIEADESDRSLLRFRPDWAVITNMSSDHYGIDETKDLFRAFRRQVKRGVVGGEAAAAGFAPEVAAGGSRFRYGGVEFSMHLPGRHNAENAWHAAMLCERLGCDLRRVAEALASFRGIHRRLETVGTARGVTVIDDYAHNPAKIRASWEALAAQGARITAAWRPHGYRPLAAMMGELTDLFGALCRPGDRLIILPVYDAGGTADRSVHAGMLVERLAARGVPAAVESTDTVAAAIAATAREGETVLLMGARDPQLPDLARRILAALQSP